MPYSSNLKQFHEAVIEDYNRSLEVEDIATVKTREVGDDSFLQFGRRMLIPEEVFESFVHSFGREVAIGEADFLLEQLLKHKDIEHIDLDEPSQFTNYLNFHEPLVILSTSFYVEIFSNFMDRIEYGKGHPLLYGAIPIISIPEKILGRRIIVLEKNAILLEKELFTDQVTGKKEKINVITKQLSGFDVEVLVRSVLKLSHVDPTRVKILEVKDEVLV